MDNYLIVRLYSSGGKRKMLNWFTKKDISEGTWLFDDYAYVNTLISYVD